jgi:dTDP-4-dehydrorhamnose reductase
LDRSASVRPIATAAYPTPARRPSYSLLDCGATRELLNQEPQHWRTALAEVLAAIHAHQRPAL